LFGWLVPLFTVTSVDHMSMCCSYKPGYWSGRLQRGVGRVLQTAGNAPACTGDPTGSRTYPATSVTDQVPRSQLYSL